MLRPKPVKIACKSTDICGGSGCPKAVVRRTHNGRTPTTRKRGIRAKITSSHGASGGVGLNPAHVSRHTQRASIATSARAKDPVHDSARGPGANRVDAALHQGVSLTIARPSLEGEAAAQTRVAEGCRRALCVGQTTAHGGDTAAVSTLLSRVAAEVIGRVSAVCLRSGAGWTTGAPAHRRRCRCTGDIADQRIPHVEIFVWITGLARSAAATATGCDTHRWRHHGATTRKLNAAHSRRAKAWEGKVANDHAHASTHQICGVVGTYSCEAAIRIACRSAGG